MTCTTSTPRLRSRRLTSHARCQSPLSRCRSKKNLKRSSHRNQQYSITAITDAVVERYAYTAYGTPTITDASGTTRTTTVIGNRYTYTGREWDETLALYHYRARIYDSVAGRFVSRDPIGFEGSKWLLFEFLNGDPLNRLDPYGKEWGTVGGIDFNPWDDDPIEDVDWIDSVLRNGTKVGHGMIVSALVQTVKTFLTSGLSGSIGTFAFVNFLGGE